MPSQIFAFPFAGGSSYSYNTIFDHLPSEVSNRTFELPGRGSRSKISVNANLVSMATEAYLELREANPSKCLLYGHSMGALLAYLVIRKIAQNKDDIEVSHLVVTGCVPPSYRNVPPLSKLSDEELVEKIIAMDGTPNDLWQEKELWDFFLPVIRSDFKAFEEYVYMKEAPLNIPITVITGTDEFIKNEHLTGWNDVSNYPVDFLRMPGGHFFIHKHAEELAVLLARLAFKEHSQ